MSSNKFLFGGFVAVYLLVCFIALSVYMPWTSVNFILGCLILPFTFHGAGYSKPSSRLMFPAILFVSFSFFTPVPTVLFLAIIISLLCLVEHKTGKLSLLAFVVLLCMTPSIQYLVGVFSFPIRLWLTGVAGKVLNLTGIPASVAGNVITFGKLDYTVDAACMGVKMFLTSLLCGLFVLLFLQKRQHKKLPGGYVLLCMSAIFLLNLLANIIRIIVLVYFNIRPEATMHEITGLVCLVIYVLVPGFFLARFVINKAGRYATPPDTAAANQLIKSNWVPHLLLLITCVASCLQFKSRTVATGSTANLVPVNGYAVSCYNNDVAQYSNDHSLTYIKKIEGFLYADHNPVICWIGSGYEFESLTETKVDGDNVYLGTLKKGNERLYTSWWYDNGTYTTTSQLDWRWRALKGANNFSVVNVTSADKNSLLAELKKIKKENTFRKALK